MGRTHRGTETNGLSPHSPSPARSLELAAELARQALALDDSLAEFHRAHREEIHLSVTLAGVEALDGLAAALARLTAAGQDRLGLA